MPHPPETYAAIEQVSSPAWSRDGKRIHYLRGSGMQAAWSRDLATGADTKLTDHDEKVALIRRAPTDERIAYGIDRGGDERQQLWLLEPGAPARALTDDPAVIHDWGGWSPDGRSVVVAANDRDEAHFDLLEIDAATGARRRLREGRGIVAAAGYRADGARIAALEDRGHCDMTLLVLDAATGEVAARFEEPGSAQFQSVRWASDKRTLLALTTLGGSDMLRLCRLDPDTGGCEVVHEAPGREVDGWAASPDGATLATLENDRGWSVLRVGPAGGDRRVVDLPPCVVGDLAFSPDGAALAFSVSAPERPGSIWIWRGGRAAPEIEIAPAVADFAPWELVEWESFDGWRIPGWLVLPPGAPPAGGHRAIVWVHGGPVGQTRPNFRPDIQMLVSQGYAVLLPNVRGSAGYGRAWAESDDGGKRLDCVRDMLLGRDWLAAHPAIDGARIAIMGQSYGGYMVNAALTEAPQAWKAAVNYYGIYDFASTLRDTGPWRRSHRAAEYGDPDRDAGVFARISPIHKVDAIRAPMLLAHGTRDPRVPYGESVQLDTALRERQRTVEFLTFDYAGHGFVRPDDRRRVFGAVAGFFARHV